eukprot:4067217-Alexandrium_andersonii.AAC.1
MKHGVECANYGYVDIGNDGAGCGCGRLHSNGGQPKLNAGAALMALLLAQCAAGARGQDEEMGRSITVQISPVDLLLLLVAAVVFGMMI